MNFDPFLVEGQFDIRGAQIAAVAGDRIVFSANRNRVALGIGASEATDYQLRVDAAATATTGWLRGTNERALFLDYRRFGALIGREWHLFQAAATFDGYAFEVLYKPNRAMITSFDPVILEPAFDVGTRQIALVAGVAQQLFPSNRNRIALLVGASQVTNFQLQIDSAPAASRGFLLDAGMRFLALSYIQYGALIGREWWVQSGVANNLYAIEVIFTPSRIGGEQT